MLRRRRYVVFVVILLGFIWFVIVPLFSKDDLAVALQRHGETRHSAADGLNALEGSRPLHSLKRTTRNTQVHSSDTVANAGDDDDDLSEIEFPPPELPAFKSGKVKSNERNAHVVGVWIDDTRHRRRGRATPRAPVQTSKFNKSHHKQVNAPGETSMLICLHYIHSCIFLVQLPGLSQSLHY